MSRAEPILLAPESVRIRAYHGADLEVLLEVWKLATQLAHPFMIEVYLAQERQAIIEQYLPATETWIAECQNSVIGFGCLLGGSLRHFLYCQIGMVERLDIA